MSPPVVLTVAGSDSGGGAGIAADLTTFAALGVHGAVAITAVTAQSTTGVDRITVLDPDDVVAQLRAVFDDLPVAAVKAGMLGSAAIADALIRTLPVDVPLVIDPVLAATSGAALAPDELIRAYRDVVLPRATVATPNRGEAAVLLDGLGSFPCPTLITDSGSDVLADPYGADPHGAERRWQVQRVETSNDHGTGCTHSAAIAAYLALGRSLPDAARMAQKFVAARLRDSAAWDLGHGRGPVSHLFSHATHTKEH
jgi:hydroxymethylpyrimidine/phosphomethylpyrimidine kinase